MLRSLWKPLSILTAVAVCLAAPLWSQNLIPNGDFESTDGEKLSGWTTLYAPNAVSLIGEDGGFVRGKVSAHLKSENAVSAPGNKTVVLASGKLAGIVPGTEYRLTFYAKSPVPSQSMDVYYYTAPDVKPHFYKQKSFLLNENWNKYSFVLKLPAEAEWNNRSLYIRFSLGYGEIYLDDVVLSENVAETSAPIAVLPKQKNLLVNPGFELGWLGWGPQSYRLPATPYEEKEIPSAIDTEVKYEGTASLRIEPNGCIGSSRYPLELGKPYTFSFYARAEAASGSRRDVKVHVITPTWKIVTRTLVVGKDLDAQWRRFSIPVQIAEQGSAFRNSVYIRIDSVDNTVWFDAAQLEQGEMTGYEASLQAGVETSNPLGRYTLGKSENISIVVSGTGGVPKPLTVSLSARDMFSNTIWKKEIAVSPSKNERILTPLTLENHSLGVMEVTAVVSLTGERPLSANAWRYAVIDAGEARQNPLFGTENVFGRSPLWLEEWNERMANTLGSGWTRVFLWDGPGELGLGGETLAIYKRQLGIKKASGKMLMICLDLPKEAKINPGLKYDNEITEAEVNEDLASGAERAKKIASELKDTVDYYQILNEPNIWTARTGSKKGMRLMPPERYLRFLALQTAAIREVYPKAKCAANINGIDLNYVEALFALGAAKYIDAFTFHSYRQAPENPPVYDDIKRLRALIDKYAKGMPIFNDEQYFGVRDQVAHTGEDDRDYYSDTEEEQAGRLLQNYLHHIASALVPHSQFAVNGTLYRFGMSHPVHYYEAFGGVRFLSQTLYDLVDTAQIELHPSVRVFLFERKDGVKIVSVNARMFGVKGGVRNLAADAVFDANGNRQSLSDFPISFLPTFISFGPATSREAAITALKRADFYGFDAPLRAGFEMENGKLVVNLENCENKSLDATFSFVRMPDGFRTPASFELKGLAGRSTKSFSFPVTTGELSWDKDYPIEYRALVGDSVISKTARLPSIRAAKASMMIDGNLDDWKSIPKMNLGEERLSADFSGGKLPHSPKGDLSATSAISWDEKHLYVAVDVNDDVFFKGTGDEGMFWANDSVQIYFDMGNEAGKTYDGNDAAYSIGLNKNGEAVAWLDKNPTGRYVGANNVDKGVDPDVKVAFKKTSAGHVFEIAFPRVALPYLELKEGSVFGFSLLVNDNDGQGRKQGVTLGPKGTEPFGKPSIWKTVRLSAP